MTYPLSIENRLLAAIMTDEETHQWVEHLEVDDFTHPYNRVAFGAFRNLQAQGNQVGILAIADELVRDDKARNRCVAEWVTVEYLTGLVTSTTAYRHRLERRDGAWLLDGQPFDFDAYARIQMDGHSFVRALHGPDAYVDTTFTDEAAQSFARHVITQDIAVLKTVRALADQGLTHDGLSVSDQDQRVPEQRSSRRERAGRAARQRQASRAVSPRVPR